MTRAARVEARLHPRFPERVRVVVEQPPDEPMRLRWVPERGAFERTAARSLAHARGFRGAYGWIAGTGEPPGVHYDAFVVTERDAVPGEAIESVVVGVFVRGDGDHKLLTVDATLPWATDVAAPGALPPRWREQVCALYPRVDAGEGWRDAERAREMLRSEPPTHD